MSQMKLITDNRAEWTVKDLVETLHAKVDDLELKLDAQLAVNASIQWHLNAIILHLAGDRAALTAFVMASEPTVVPNEDEAMPVVEEDERQWPVDTRPILASCPTCGMTAYTDAAVEHAFGYRTPTGRETIVQSWCRECRSAGKDQPSPTRNVRTRMPADVRALSQEATKLAREGQALIKKAMDGASANSGRMSLEDKKLLDAGTVKMTESKKLQSQYNRERELITYPNGRK